MQLLIMLFYLTRVTFSRSGQFIIRHCRYLIETRTVETHCYQFRTVYLEFNCRK